jgi:hypothetical protein
MGNILVYSHKKNDEIFTDNRFLLSSAEEIVMGDRFHRNGFIIESIEAHNDTLTFKGKYFEKTLKRTEPVYIWRLTKV